MVKAVEVTHARLGEDGKLDEEPYFPSLRTQLVLCCVVCVCVCACVYVCVGGCV